jgi:hypothetical protein
MSVPEIHIDLDELQRQGTQMARRLFAKRGNHSEIHVSELQLAAMLTIACQTGAAHQARKTLVEKAAAPDLLSVAKKAAAALMAVTEDCPAPSLLPELHAAIDRAEGRSNQGSKL